MEHIGIDFHKRDCQICILAEQGEIKLGLPEELRSEIAPLMDSTSPLNPEGGPYSLRLTFGPASTGQPKAETL